MERQQERRLLEKKEKLIIERSFATTNNTQFATCQLGSSVLQPKFLSGDCPGLAAGLLLLLLLLLRPHWGHSRREARSSGGADDGGRTGRQACTGGSRAARRVVRQANPPRGRGPGSGGSEGDWKRSTNVRTGK